MKAIFNTFLPLILRDIFSDFAIFVSPAQGSLRQLQASRFNFV